MSLNTEHWKKFRISDIFCPFINGRGITEQEIEDNPGKLAAIQSSSEKTHSEIWNFPDFCGQWNCFQRIGNAYCGFVKRTSGSRTVCDCK